MGQKVNPHGLRVGIIKDWDSKWYADKKTFGDNLVEDYKIRTFLKKTLFAANVSKVEIERANNKLTVSINTARPGVIIGKNGSEIDKLKAATCDRHDARLLGRDDRHGRHELLGRLRPRLDEQRIPHRRDAGRREE